MWKNNGEIIKYPQSNMLLHSIMIFSIIDVELPVVEKIKLLTFYLHNRWEKYYWNFTISDPLITISRNITRLTGISNETVKDAPMFFEIAKEY